MAGRTQAALYAEIALDLSWSEEQLPQVERTKHVHGLHPYLGKFVPQVAEYFLRRHFRPGDLVYDPFVGSGTTLVEANVLGLDAVGTDVSAFNCLLSSVKTGRFSLPRLELALRGLLEEARRAEPVPAAGASDWLARWIDPAALSQLLTYRAASASLPLPEWAVASLVLSRAARSARRVPHFDLDAPREPVTVPYWCHKHRRTCRPVQEAAKFLRRYSADTVRRLRAFSAVRTGALAEARHADARTAALPAGISGILTSPPYPGLLDYHEQHRYAYELLALPDRREEEIGPAERGHGRGALERYVDDVSSVFLNARRFLVDGAPVVIVVNDARTLYPEILARSGLALEETLTRHVNRRTGRRAGEFYESILVCRPA